MTATEGLATGKAGPAVGEETAEEEPGEETAKLGDEGLYDGLVDEGMDEAGEEEEDHEDGGVVVARCSTGAEEGEGESPVEGDEAGVTYVAVVER